MLEADLQDLASIAHEPSSFWIRKSDGPEAAHSRQVEPSATFIRSPGRFSRGEVRRRLGGDHDGMLVFLAEFFILAMANAADIGQAENGSLHGGLVRKSPRLAAIVGGCRVGGIV
jgi:hypothetical protein